MTTTAGDPTRLGLLGGTFDPPHIGHLVAAAWARQALSLDAVWLVVAHRPWQKVGRQSVSSVADRLAMVRAAAEGIEGVAVSTIEIDRGGDSYTADTIADLAAREPAAALFVIVGADAAAGLETWVRPEDVKQGATVVVVDRAGADLRAVPVGWAYERVEIPRLDVSSTELRARVRAGLPIDGLVPAGVCSVIRARGLYRGASV